MLLAEAVASLARSYLEQQGRMELLEQKHTTMAEYLRPFIQRTNERLTALEIRLSSGTTISEDQAAELAQHVKNVAARLRDRVSSHYPFEPSGYPYPPLSPGAGVRNNEHAGENAPPRVTARAGDRP